MSAVESNTLFLSNHRQQRGASKGGGEGAFDALGSLWHCSVPARAAAGAHLREHTPHPAEGDSLQPQVDTEIAGKLYRSTAVVAAPGGFKPGTGVA